jgi:hypothetical protein
MFAIQFGFHDSGGTGYLAALVGASALGVASGLPITPIVLRGSPRPVRRDLRRSP